MQWDHPDLHFLSLFLEQMSYFYFMYSTFFFCYPYLYCSYSNIVFVKHLNAFDLFKIKLKSMLLELCLVCVVAVKFLLSGDPINDRIFILI